MLDTLLDSARLRLTVAFQPIVDLRTDAVVGYEALGRVRPVPGEAGRPPGPAAFLDQAHRAGRLAEGMRSADRGPRRSRGAPPRRGGSGRPPRLRSRPPDGRVTPPVPALSPD